jgi:hypothetical protein
VQVLSAVRVLAAVEQDNQAPLATNKVAVVAVDRLLPREFEASEAGDRECVSTRSILPA